MTNVDGENQHCRQQDHDGVGAHWAYGNYSKVEFNLIIKPSLNGRENADIFRKYFFFIAGRRCCEIFFYTIIFACSLFNDIRGCRAAFFNPVWMSPDDQIAKTVKIQSQKSAQTEKLARWETSIVQEIDTRFSLSRAPRVANSQRADTCVFWG